MSTNKYLVSIWFDGDIGPASIEFTREFHPNRTNVQKIHDELTAEVMKQFSRCAKVKIQTLDKARPFCERAAVKFAARHGIKMPN